MRGAAVVTGALVLAHVALSLPGEAAAQADPPGAGGRDRIVREWALRGVVISDAGRSALIEHLPTGRGELVKVGEALSPSVAVVTIDPDLVVLDAGGDAPVTLRLGHGGARPVVRRPAAAVRRPPVSVPRWQRWRGATRFVPRRP